MVIANSRGLYYELDHRHLVDECGRVFNTRGFLRRGLVQTAGEPRVYSVFV